MKAISTPTSLMVLREVRDVIEVGGGFKAVVNLDGTVVSPQPNGSEETRTAVGAWERARPKGNLLVFRYGVRAFYDDLAD